MKRLIAITLITIVLVIAYYEQVLHALTIAGYVLAGMLAILFVTAFLIGLWYVSERVRMIRATRIELEKQANVMVVTNNGQTWIRDTNPKAYWKAGHLEQRVYSNGQYSEPNAIEAQAWQMFNAPRTVTSKATLLPEVTQAPVDLLQALDSVQRCLVVGVTDTGKTTLLQHIVNRRLQTSKVIVIDPHAYPDKWAGCKVVGTGRNYQEIDRELKALIEVMTKRYGEIGRGMVTEMGHNRLTVLIDEWRAITFNLGKPASEAIKALLTESRKAAFSVFVASQSDRAKPLGLEGEYDLKDGFAVVRLSIANGMRQATLDMGNGEMPASLPGQFLNGQTVNQNTQVQKMIEAGLSNYTISKRIGNGNRNDKIYEYINSFRKLA